MKKLLSNIISKNQFVKHVSILAGGTTVAQAIAILSLPILTRIYTPEDFSVLAVYSSILSLLAVVSCLRLEIAIPLPKSNRMAASLCVLSVLSILLVSLFTTLLIVIKPEVINITTNNKISNYLGLIPIGVLFVGMYNALQYWHTRRKNFTLIAKTRMSQSLSGTSVKLLVGYFMSGWVMALVVGQLLSFSAGFLSLGIGLIKRDWKYFKGIRLRHLFAALKRYDKFPKYSTFEAFANTGSTHIPVLIIAYYSTGADAGYLMLAMQLLSAPMSLIGTSVAQVYLTEGAKKYHESKLRPFTRNTIYTLVKLASLPMILVCFLAPFIMTHFLGEQWGRTGTLISWMVPSYFMQFIVSPVSMSLHIAGKQKVAFLLQISGLLLRVGIVLIFTLINVNYLGEAYALSGFLFYSIYLKVVLNSLQGTK